MAQSTSRLDLDLEEIERQMRQARPAPPASAADPLADLARIVGQDDPFRSVLANDRGPVTAHDRDGPDAGRDEAFERMLAEARHDRDQQEANRGPDHAPPYDTDDDAYPVASDALRHTERSRSRKGLITVVAVVGVGLAAVIGALAIRGGASLTASGEPPVVQAGSEPLKVRPENPGGVDIPDQNKQIYERGAQDGQTKVVNREEQPLDVQQAARALPPTPPSAAAGPTASPSLGPAGPSATSALGEPRRVRTVTVRPDGTFVTPGEAASSATPTATRPSASAATSADAATARLAPTPAPLPEASQGATTPQPIGGTSRSVAPPAAPPRTQSAPPPSPAAAPADSGPQRTASIPTRPAAAPTAAPAAPAAGATAAVGGAFSVQLAVGATEPEARTLATNLRQRFAGDLGSRAPSIRRAELNGKTLFRVRVEQLSRDEANALCTKLRTAGGQCFIAKN